MITVCLAFIISVGMFAFIWRTVRQNAIIAFGSNAAMTFTPEEYKPALDANGNLVRDPQGFLVKVPTGSFVSFEPRHERYTKVAEVVTTLASASLIFVPGSRLNVYPHSCAFALVLLGFSVLYCIGFMVALTYFYEGFLYNRNSYSPTKYSLVHALGFAGWICFALAYIWLAGRVGWSVIYAANTPNKLFP